jgi:hypothetical protein
MMNETTLILHEKALMFNILISQVVLCPYNRKGRLS